MSAAAFDPRNPNLKVWLENEPTDPAYTKPITGKAYKGTALNGEYVMKRLTAAFGPVGWGWGYKAAMREIHLPDGSSLAMAEIRFWYFPFGRLPDDLANEVCPRYAYFDQIGGTELAGTRKSGASFNDDDAHKKSLTDALLKAASHIGIGGDIHLGMMDDSKYVEQRRDDVAKASAAIDKSMAEEARREAIALSDAMALATDTTTLMEIVDTARVLHPKLKELGLPDAAKALAHSVQAEMKRLGVAPPPPAAAKEAA